MLETNVDVLLNHLEPTASVLDVGGWYIPFNRADSVVDLMPYETRGRGQGPGPERFDSESWVQLDVCREPLPFEDKSFDFAVCSHTLEDIRDPIFLCSELNRVAKAGYIETPSLIAELTFGIESKRYAGWYHHRWLVTMQNDRITFRHKPHLIHGNWRYHLPKRMARSLTPAERVTWMLWEGSFGSLERVELAKDKVEEEIRRFVRDTDCRPDWRYRLAPAEDALRRVRSIAGTRARSFLSRANR